MLVTATLESSQETTGEESPLANQLVGSFSNRSPVASNRGTSGAKVEMVVDGGRVANLAQGIREIWIYRDTIFAFAERNIRLKYNQAVLGVAWALIQPLAFLSIFVFIFGRSGISPGVASYPAFALSTLVPWMFLQTAVSFGAQGLLNDGALVKKVYFAREAPILGAALSACVDFGAGLSLVVVAGPFLGMHFSWATFLAVPLCLILLLLASGVAMALGALTVYYRDFRYVLPLILQMWMFASPVAYPLTAVPQQWRSLYVLANPAAGILDGFRRTLAEGHAPVVLFLTVSLAGTLLIAGLGYWLFRRLEPGFADII